MTASRESRRGEAVTILEQGMWSLAGYGTVLLVTRSTEPTEQAWFALAWTLLSFGRVLAERWTGGAYTVLAPHQADEAGFLWAAWRRVGVGAVALALATSVGAAIVSLPSSTRGFAVSLVVLAPTLALVAGRDHVRWFLLARLRSGAAVRTTAAGTAVQLVVLGIIVEVTGSAPAALAAVAVAQLVPLAWWWYRRPLATDRPEPEQRKRFDEALTRTGRWLVASRAFPVTASVLVPLILAARSGSVEAGVFVALVSLSNLSIAVIHGVNNTTHPRSVAALAAGRPEEFARLVRRAILALTTILVAVVLAAATIGDPALELLYGERFGTRGDELTLLAVSTLVVSWSAVSGNAALALGSERAMLVGEVAYGVVTVGVAIALVDEHGSAGAATGLIAGSAVAAVLHALGARGAWLRWHTRALDGETV